MSNAHTTGHLKEPPKSPDRRRDSRITHPPSSPPPQRHLRPQAENTRRISVRSLTLPTSGLREHQTSPTPHIHHHHHRHHRPPSSAQPSRPRPTPPAHNSRPPRPSDPHDPPPPPELKRKRPFVPARPSTPYPRGPPPSSHDSEDEYQASDESTHPRPRRRKTSSRGSHKSHQSTVERLKAEEKADSQREGTASSNETGDYSPGYVDYSFADPFIAQAALKRARRASQAGRGSSLFDMYRRKSHNNLRRQSGNLADMDSSSDDEQNKTQGMERWRLDSATLIAPPGVGVRKEPLHRKLSATKLRPALRGFGVDPGPQRGFSSPIPGAGFGMTGPIDQRKPLPPPPRPDAAAAMASGGYFGGGAGFMDMGMGMGMTGISNRPLSPPMSPNHSDFYANENQSSQPFSLSSLRQSLPQFPFGSARSRAFRNQNYPQHQGPQQPRPMSPYSSGSMERTQRTGFMNASMPNINDVLRAPSKRSLMEPADNLNAYLRHAEIPKWDKWIDPAVQASSISERGRWQNRNVWGSGTNRRTNYFGGVNGKAQTVERMVNSTLQAMVNEPGGERNLQSWECRRNFFDAIEEFFSNNVPYTSIRTDDRWGEQIFAIEADGFETVGFYDEAAQRAEDAGLLGWLTGCLLQTALSALHLLRFNASDFCFQVLPSSVAPSRRDAHGRSHFTRGGARRENITELPDGCGSLVLVNRKVPLDRAMIVVVRPPWLIGNAELREFVRAAPEWRRGTAEYLNSAEGQHNLLQTQIYDDCVKNFCFFFCVTNLKAWVFGHFNPDFTRCAISPIINRRARNPSVMQVLSVWCLRAVDERPRDAELASHPVPTNSFPVPSPQAPPYPGLPHPPPHYNQRDLPSVPDGLRGFTSIGSMPTGLPPSDRHMRGQSLPPQMIYTNLPFSPNNILTGHHELVESPVQADYPGHFQQSPAYGPPVPSRPYPPSRHSPMDYDPYQSDRGGRQSLPRRRPPYPGEGLMNDLGYDSSARQTREHREAHRRGGSTFY